MENSQSSSSSCSSTSSSSSSSDSDGNYFLQYRKERSFQHRITENYYTDDEFKSRYRFSKSPLGYLEKLVENDLSHTDNRGCPLTVKPKIMLALRYYATGYFQNKSADLIGISQSTVCYTVHNVSKAFARLGKYFIKMPETQIQRGNVIKKFYRLNNFLTCYQ